jgi:exosortase
MRSAIWGGFIALIFANYWPTLKWMVERWEEKDSFMAHGWLILPISLFLLYQRKQELTPAVGKKSTGSLWGAAIVFASLAIHFISGLADVSSISGMTMAFAILGFALLFEGKAFVVIAWFPILFLAFMVPPPEFVISKLNFSLKLMAADMATWILNMVGMPAIRHGSYMLFGEDKLAIGDVCSGLRSLLALLDLGVLFAYMVRDRGRLQVMVVLLMAIPAAIIGNGIRIFIVSCLVSFMGQEFVFKPRIGTWDIHLFSGATIFIAAFGCLFLAVSLVDKLKTASPSDPK